MIVGVVEVMPTGHFTLVDSVIRIYLADPSSKVILFTHKRGTVLAKPIIDEFKGRLSIDLWDERSTIELASKINNSEADIVYFITLEKYFDLVLKIRDRSSIRLFVHNIEQWFGSSMYSMLRQFYRRMSLSRSDVYLFKQLFIFQIKRQKVGRKLLNSQAKFVVLSNAVRAELTRFVPSNRIEIIPFSVFLSNKLINVKGEKLLHITIPGMVDAVRRNYLDLFRALIKRSENLKGKVVVELLGGVAKKEGGEEILKEAESVQRHGIDMILYNENYIPLERFDERLQHADFILGNMNVSITPDVVYGRTKESGIQFTMVRAAKPGFLPANYPVTEELISSTVIFNGYDHLIELVLFFLDNPREMTILKQKALQNSKRFEPESVLKNLLQ